MKELWNGIQFIFTMFGGRLGYFLGGCDGLLIALVMFVVMEYISGVMCALQIRTKPAKSDSKASAERCLFSCLWELQTFLIFR